MAAYQKLPDMEVFFWTRRILRLDKLRLNAPSFYRIAGYFRLDLIFDH